MRRSVCLGLAIVLVVSGAGCLGIGGSEDGESDDEAVEPTSDASDEQAASPEAVNGSEDGSSGRLVWGNQTGSWVGGVHAQKTPVYLVGAPAGEASVSDNATGLVAIVTWEATTPLAEELVVDLADGEANVLASASGASPLSVPVEGSSLEGVSQIRSQVYPTSETAGTWVAQSYDVTTVVFEDLAFEPGRVSP